MILVALQTLRINSRQVRISETFEVSENLAKQLIDRGLAREQRVKVEVVENDAPLCEQDLDIDDFNLESLSLKDLRGIAKERGIEGYSKMKKHELILAIEGCDEPQR